MVADIFEDFDPPSKKFLATPLEKYSYTIQASPYLDKKA